MFKRLVLAAGALAALAVSAPSFGHPGVIVTHNPATGATCYVVPRHDPAPESHDAFWFESNGATKGGDATGVGFVNHKLHMAPTGGLNAEADEAYRQAAGQQWWDTWRTSTATGLQRSLAPFGADANDPAQRFKDDAGQPIQATDTFLGTGAEGLAAFIATCA